MDASNLARNKRFAVVALFVGSILLHGVQGQNACELDCIKDIYDRACGGASCITRVGSSSEFAGLCGSTCLDAISADTMLECLMSVGGSQDVHRSFIHTVESFCSQGDPFAAPAPASSAPPESAPPPDLPDTDDDIAPAPVHFIDVFLSEYEFQALQMSG